MTADADLTEALEHVRAATGTREGDATLVRRLAVVGARIEPQTGSDRRAAAETLLAAMDRDEFDLDLNAVDRLNGQTFAA